MKQNFQMIHDAAHAAGMAAVEKTTPTPMIVQGGGKQYFVPDGLCGFAWINVKPNRPGTFARWAKEKGIGRADSYAGGVTIWVSDFNQSVAKKEAYAQAYADVLKQCDIAATSHSRLD